MAVNLGEFSNRWDLLQMNLIIRPNVISNFRYLENDLNGISKKLIEIRDNKDSVPEFFSQEFFSFLDHSWSYFRKIEDYDQQTFSSNFEQIKEHLTGLITFINVKWPIINLFIEHEKLKKYSTTDVDSIKENAAEIERLKNKASEDLDNLENEAKPLISKLLLLDYTDDFSKAAKRNKIEATWWLMALVSSILIFAITILCFLNTSFNYQDLELSIFHKSSSFWDGTQFTLFYFEIAKSIFYRILIISLLIFIIKVCSNNYKSAMHNHTINAHKANALIGGISLIKLPFSDKVKDDILQYAAVSIFSHQPTGYNDKEVENIGIGDRVIEKVIEKLPSVK